MERYVAAIDQGTTSSRCIVFDADGRASSPSARRSTGRSSRGPAGSSTTPEEIWAQRARSSCSRRSTEAGSSRPADLAAVGITNQRETTVLWDRRTGDAGAQRRSSGRTPAPTQLVPRARRATPARTASATRCGLPLATYFSGPKIRWLLDNVAGLRERAEAGEVLFGTMDTWLIWKLTGRHVTDVTNASRTMLMNLATLDWDDELLDAIGHPARDAAGDPLVVGGLRRGAGQPLAGVPVASALGDQQAALFGQTCFAPGEAKCTYGTGSFLLLNTGERAGAVRTRPAHHGRLPDRRRRAGRYALEGSIAVTGALVQWLRDNLGLIGSAAEIETLARTVDGQRRLLLRAGLLRPVRAALALGRARRDRRAHRLRHQGPPGPRRARGDRLADARGGRRDERRLRPGPDELRVDGGMTANNLLMQFQADVLDVPVVRPIVAETTCLGAAYAAGLAVGYWPDTDSLRAHWHKAAEWLPR